MNKTPLLDLFKELEKLRKSEPKATFINIGGRGYYENPTSSLLQFFLIPSNQHGLGTLFIEAFRDAAAIALSNQELTKLTGSREVKTAMGNRIDLLLEGPGWILLIENKIWHDQVNPFQDYENHARQNKKPNAKEFFVILSPSGESKRAGWTGLSYLELITAIDERLDECDVTIKASKWWHFAKDFTLHLNQEIYGTAMNENEIKFVEENYEQLDAATKLHQRFRIHLMTHLPELLEGLCSKKDLWTKDHGWAIRLYHKNWNGSNIAWWNDWTEQYRLKLSVFIESPTVAQLNIAKSIFDKLMDYKPDSKDQTHHWDVRGYFENRKAAEVYLKTLATDLFKIYTPDSES